MYNSGEMKRLLAHLFIVLGLLLGGLTTSANAKEIKIYHKDENSISITRSSWSEAKMFKVAANHCAQYKKFAFTFGVFNKQGVLDEKRKPTRLYHCSRTKLTKSPLTGKDNIHWTNYDENHEFAQQQKEDKKFAKLEGYKTTCEVLGFKPGSEKFADCALKLFIADNKESQVVQSSSGTQEVIIRDPDREQRIRLRKFNDRISGKCGWTDWNC